MDDVYIVGFPSRIGIRTDIIEKVFSQDVKERFLKLKESEYIEQREKINITIPELTKIFGNKIVNITKLKLILTPFYNQSNADLKIEKMGDNDIKRVILENSVSGVYRPLEYVDSFYPTNKSKINFRQFDNVKFFKIIQNERSINEVVNWLEKRIKCV